MREQRGGKFLLNSQRSPQPYDLHHVVERWGQRAAIIYLGRASNVAALGARFGQTKRRLHKQRRNEMGMELIWRHRNPHFFPEETEKRILRGYCRVLGPRSALSIHMLGL